MAKTSSDLELLYSWLHANNDREISEDLFYVRHQRLFRLLEHILIAKKEFQTQTILLLFLVAHKRKNVNRN